jgi:hypothetical protein
MFEVVNHSKFKPKKYLLMTDLICRSSTVERQLCRLSKRLQMMASTFKTFTEPRRHKLNLLNLFLLMMDQTLKIFMAQKKQQFLFKQHNLSLKMMD